MVQKSPFSEPVEAIKKFIPKWKAGKWFRFQLTVVRKSSFAELLELATKFILESKTGLSCGASGNSEQNCAPVRSILKIVKIIAPVRSILEISLFLHQKTALLCGASFNFRRVFIKNRAPMRSILKIRSVSRFIRQIYLGGDRPYKPSSKFT